MTTANDAIQVDLASPKLLPLYQPNNYRYFVLKGGRGSGKSYAVGQALVIEAYTSFQRVLCLREYQVSIAESVHQLLRVVIDDLGLTPYFEITKTHIRCPHTGSEFFFKGCQDMPAIKSIAGVTRVWVEEAATIGKEQWSTLIPTIREENSKFLICYNPLHDDDYTHTHFGLSNSPDTCVININWDDNKYFPQVLEAERQKCLATSIEDYEHIWGGGTQTISDAQVFKGRFRVEEFVEQFDRSRAYYFGLDFGFRDPTAGVRTYIENGTLYITHELYAGDLTLDQIPGLLVKTLPDLTRWPIYCDQSRPDSILYLKQKGFNAIGAGKGAGSIEDGIEFMKSMPIVIHSRCVNTIREFSRYSYKVDRISGAILPILVDAENHLIDAIRYAMWTNMKSKGVASFARLAETNRGHPSIITI